MSDSFQVRGSFAILVEGEIDQPENWEEMDTQERREYIADEIQTEVGGSANNIGFDPSKAMVDEVLESAEEMFNESSE